MLRTFHRRGLLLLAGLPLLVSCRLLTPPERAPDAVAAVPDAYARRGAAGTVAPDRWWESFGDAQLNALVAAALTNNVGLAQAAARLRQAQAVAARSGAARMPSLDFEGSAATTREKSPDMQTGVVTTRTRESFGLGVAAAYEFDLWGRVGATRRAALRDAAAAQSDRNTAAMTVAAEVCLRYFDWVLQHRKRDVLEAQLATNRKALELVDLRFRRSQATALDVLQQRERVAEIEARQPLVEARLETLAHALAVLVGRAPGAEPGRPVASLPQLPPVPEVGLPASLLERRPDIQSAWHRLRAGAEGVGAARADRLPSIRLSASAAYGSDATATLFDYWATSLAASLVGPLIDGGRRRAEVARTRGVLEERVAAYRAQVLTALREVEDALVQERRQGEYLAALTRQWDAASQAADEAFRRYRRGAESYLQVLTERTLKQNLDLTLLQARYDRLATRVQLHRALGGDWETILAEGSERP